jgi:hypothetical protein
MLAIVSSSLKMGTKKTPYRLKVWRLDDTIYLFRIHCIGAAGTDYLKAPGVRSSWGFLLLTVI